MCEQKSLCFISACLRTEFQRTGQRRPQKTESRLAPSLSSLLEDCPASPLLGTQEHPAPELPRISLFALLKTENETRLAGRKSS